MIKISVKQFEFRSFALSDVLTTSAFGKKKHKKQLMQLKREYKYRDWFEYGDGCRCHLMTRRLFSCTILHSSKRIIFHILKKFNFRFPWYKIFGGYLILFYWLTVYSDYAIISYKVDFHCRVVFMWECT